MRHVSHYRRHTYVSTGHIPTSSPVAYGCLRVPHKEKAGGGKYIQLSFNKSPTASIKAFAFGINSSISSSLE